MRQIRWKFNKDLPRIAGDVTLPRFFQIAP